MDSTLTSSSSTATQRRSRSLRSLLTTRTLGRGRTASHRPGSARTPMVSGADVGQSPAPSARSAQQGPTPTTCFSLGLSVAAGNLAPGAIAELGPGFHKDDFSGLVQSNDYSYKPATTFVQNMNVTVYFAGALMMGRSRCSGSSHKGDAQSAQTATAFSGIGLQLAARSLISSAIRPMASRWKTQQSSADRPLR